MFFWYLFAQILVTRAYYIKDPGGELVRMHGKHRSCVATQMISGMLRFYRIDQLQPIF